MRNARSYKWVGYVYVYPAVLYMLVLVGYPIVYNVLLSFQNVDMTNLTSGEHRFVGLSNYADILSKEIFATSLKNTLVYTVFSIIFQFSIGFALALFFQSKLKFASFLRGLMLVSWMSPIVVTALLFKFMFSTGVGIINYLLLSAGWIDRPMEWLTDPGLAMAAVITANIWIGIPFNMILLAAGLSNLPQDIYESAGIDGANRAQKFLYLTVPLLRPIMMVVMILGFIYTFKVFDLVYVMTGGGPVDATEVLSTLSYRYSFDQFQFSSGATVSNILFLILLLISFLYLKMIRSDEVM